MALLDSPLLECYDLVAVRSNRPEVLMQAVQHPRVDLVTCHLEAPLSLDISVLETHLLA